MRPGVFTAGASHYGVADLENIALRQVGGTPLFVRNVATVTLGPDFRRVRIGIGHPGPGQKEKVTPHVLGNYAKSEMEALSDLLAAIAGEAEEGGQQGERGDDGAPVVRPISSKTEYLNMD